MFFQSAQFPFKAFGFFMGEPSVGSHPGFVIAHGIQLTFQPTGFLPVQGSGSDASFDASKARQMLAFVKGP